jgi:hypothetical protein
MPVIRISDATWERLKVYARPLEDSPEDVVRLALDALDASRGHKPPAVKAQKRPAPQGKKTPQREFRLPLLKVMLELGGSGYVKDIRETIEPKVRDLLGPADLAPVSTGEARWWNAVCWERNDLVKEGLFRKDSDRGIWELTDAGRKAAQALA